jgi:hypothetical protein
MIGDPFFWLGVLCGCWVFGCSFGLLLFLFIRSTKAVRR